MVWVGFCSGPATDNGDAMLPKMNDGKQYEYEHEHEREREATQEG